MGLLPEKIKDNNKGWKFRRSLISVLTSRQTLFATLCLACPGHYLLPVLEAWTAPRYHQARRDETVPVRVAGLLPGRQSETEKFGMIMRRYGDRPGRWICPELAGCWAG